MGHLHYDIPDDLHRRVKAAAALRGMTLKDYVVESLDRASTDDLKKAGR